MYSRSEVFTRIYRDNAWNGMDTRAGPGSDLGATEHLARALVAFFSDAGVTSVLDAGCNECFWQPEFPGYIGADIVPEAILSARRRHPTRNFMIADLCSDPLPKVDVVLCRDALQHMSLSDGVDAIENFRRTGAWLLLAGSFDQGENHDIVTGGYYEPDLTAPPFSLGTPYVLFEDGRWADGAHWPGKFLMGFRL